MRARSLGAAALAVLITLALAHGAAFGARKARVTWRSLKPAKADGQVCVKVGGSQGTYYRLDHRKSLEFTVHGPTQVKLGKRSYTLLVSRDGKQIQKRKITAPRSARAQRCTSKKERVGAAREDTLRVPAGKHVYRVRVAEKDKAVVVRLFEQEKTQQGTRVSFRPDEYERACRLKLANGRSYIHYHATAEKPIRLRVTGPTEILVRTRLDLPPTGAAEDRYRIEVRRDGQPAGVFSYKTRRLAQAAYRDCPQIAPSEDRRLYLSVPPGTWTYELRPADATTPGFMARILIPRSAVGTGARASR
jgi:hypothetical protein